ncbi:MAG: TonB family protein, partial [Candidatus Aminicenantes bacterium]|nr:TonB family protein [Candidatus Aminicenantes bacterium]
SAGGLSHPNIVTIYDVGEAEGTTYIAMEFVEGQSLESLLAAGVRWDAVNAARFAVQVAEALELAHRKGIVHRDIKPGNILVDHEGRPHIVDFGIARIASSTMTQTNMVMGTPYYMSPEQIAGRRVDHRADIFALGAVLYEMLTREKAFPGDTLTTVIYKIMNETPAPVVAVRSDIPSGLSGIVQKALAKDLEARYGSCRELIADLRPFLSGRASIEPEPAAQTIVAPAAKKRIFGKAREGSAEPPPSGPVSGETMHAPVAPSAVSQDDAETSDRRRNKLLLVVGLMMALIIAAAGILFFAFRKSAPDIAPSGGSFNIVFADKAVAETPEGEVALPPGEKTLPDQEISAGAMAETKTETEAGTGTETGTLAGEVKTEKAEPPKPDPPKALREELKNEEVPVEKKTGVNVEAKEKPSDPVKPGEKAGESIAADEENKSVKPETPSKKAATRLPRLVKHVDPIYPEDALREGIEGDVTLNLTVGFKGRVERAVVVKSIPKLDAAAVAAARQWEFEPGLMEGIPIQATLQVTINFTPPPGTVREKAKPADPPPPPPQDDVSLARNLLTRRAWAEALALARKILASDSNQAEAKAIALDAVIQLAPGEIKSLIERYAAETGAGRAAEFFRRQAHSDVYQRLRSDLEAMAKAVRDVQVAVSKLNLDFQMAEYPDFRTRVVFSQVMTGIPSSKLYREVLFEGRYAWVLERRENGWVIVSVRVE